MFRKDKKVNRYVVLAVLCTCDMMYLLPYMRWTFYDPMIEGFGFTNTELATLGSIFGLICLFGYFLGGPICDRFSPRKILTSAFLITALAGFWLAVYPPFWACAIIHVVWGISTGVLMWDCMIRVTRTLASSKEQGRFFGLLEGGRGAISTVTSFALVAVFAYFGSNVASFQMVVVVTSAFCVAGGILTFLFISDEIAGSDDESKFEVRQIVSVIKSPAVWLIAIVILCNYAIYTGGTYLTAYLTDIMGVTVAVSAIVAVFRTYVVAMFGGPVGGFLGDKFSISKVIIVCFVLIALAAGAFVVLPSGAGIVLAVAMMIILYLGLYLMRGIYFGAVDQAKIPLKYTGTAVGFISLIGFSPEVFMNSFSGYLLDAYPGFEGYHYIFIALLVFAGIGFIASLLLHGHIKKKNAQADGSEQEVPASQ